jgi:4-diphosphocytidyl-2-C-methyl-D-erythritol kinase
MATLNVRAHAKINLSLAVLGKRSDGFHELRSVFHTISLADDIRIEWAPGSRTKVDVTASVEIPGENIATKAAHMVLEGTKTRGIVRIHIDKRIPMGGGLGGGSTDAAAVLIALSRLIGKSVPLNDLAAQLGSDVPFFLRGGCVLAGGRGEELYPLPGPKTGPGLLLLPQIHVNTALAYKSLGRPNMAELTPTGPSPILKKIQSLAWALEVRAPTQVWAKDCENDFEEVVFRQYPVLEKLRRKLGRAGAAPARMTGSGAALFGFFPNESAVQAAVEQFGQGTLACQALPFSLLSRSAYQSRWKRWLRGL